MASVSKAIGEVEKALPLGAVRAGVRPAIFPAAQTPSPSLVLPQDRILPFLGGGPLLRSSTLPENSGVLVALGGAPIELVVAQDLAIQFLQVTEHPRYLFRLREKIALRIKEAEAIADLSLGKNGNGSGKEKEGKRDTRGATQQRRRQSKATNQRRRKSKATKPTQTQQQRDQPTQTPQQGDQPTQTPQQGDQLMQRRATAERRLIRVRPCPLASSSSAAASPA